MTSAPERPDLSAALTSTDVLLDPVAATRVVAGAAGLRLLAPDGAVLGLARDEPDGTPAGAGHELSQPVAEALRDRAAQRRTRAWGSGRVMLSIDDPVVLTTVHELVQHAGGRPVHPLPVGPSGQLIAAEGDVVVLARLRTTGPPDDAWDQDSLIHLPRVRAHREGDQVHVLPLAVGEPGDVTVRSVCSRRLAASPDREALARSWVAKDSEPLPLPALAAQRVAHLLLEQVDLITGRAETSADNRARALARRTQESLDLASLRKARHSVLPVPAVAPLP